MTPSNRFLRCRRFLSVLGPVVALVIGATASVADADARGAHDVDALVGAVRGTAVHPIFGELPFTDTTIGTSDGTSVNGGGIITFDFTGLGLGLVVLKYRYTCLAAIENVSIHRFVVVESSNEALAAVGTPGMSSVVDGGGFGVADTDRAVLSPPAPPPQGPCTVSDRDLLDALPVIGFTVTAGDWIVHDGDRSYP